MVLRIIILIFLAPILISEMARADNMEFPSREASVVLPLLMQFSAKDGYSRIVQILGKEDVDVGNAVHEYVFALDSGPSITVKATLDNKVYSVQHGSVILYSAPLK